MDCNHPHCHHCEKANHWDFFAFVFALALTLFALWFSGGEALKYLIWPWLFLGVGYGVKFWVDKAKQKDKKEKNPSN